MTNIQKSRGAAPETFYLPSSSEIARCFQAGVPKVEQGLIKRGEWGAGLLGRLAVPCTIPAFHAGREQGCSWVLWDNALPCVCMRERQREIQDWTAAIPLGWAVAAVYQHKAILCRAFAEEMRNPGLGWNYRGDFRRAEFNYPSWNLARTPGLTPLLWWKVPRGL